jgi:hypothetical protein
VFDSTLEAPTFVCESEPEMQIIRLLTITFLVLVCAATVRVLGQQNDLHVIVEVKEGCVIGGVQDHRWVAAEKVEKLVKAPLTLELYTIANHETLTFVSEEEECHLGWKAQSGAELNGGVAIQSPNWNPMPRKPRAIDTHDPAYLNVVRAILLSAGLKKPEVNITEGYKIDLDGDGQDESIIVAGHAQHGVSELSGVGREVAAGDYALVLIRKIVKGQVQTIFVVKDIRRGANTGGLLRGYHISSIADLNGDGRMEIALYSAYYEGSSSDIFDLNGTKLTAVLGCGCEH